MPPCAAAPLTIAPIACSRMPNGTLRPACTRENSPAALEHRLRRLDEVGRAADHRRRVLGEAPPSPSGRPSACAIFSPASKRRQRLAPAVAQLARARRGPSRRPSSGKRLAPGVEALAPRACCAARAARRAGTCARRRARRPRSARRDRSPSPPWCARTSSSPSGRAVRLGGVDRVRRRVGDVRADRDERRPLAFPRAPRSSAASSASSPRSPRPAARASRRPARRAGWFSPSKEIEVVPSIVMWLSS